MNYKILVIEDDLEIQELIKQFLKTQNYTLAVASDGVEGIKKLNTQPFDLILLDVMMPNLNGFEVAKMIRSQSNIPIIFLTALEEEQDQMKGFDLGIDDYITKPFSFHVLIRRVQAILRRSNYKNRGNDLHFNELNVDCDGYKAYVNKEEISLTTKEFEILQLLLHNEKKVLTREIIVEKVWGYDYSGETRMIDTHIKNLRKKLNIPYIKTVKGIGYKIDE
ncbi:MULTISPECIES: response regulator transcription factor [Lysinibacillus]|jgi:two-component system response regulator VanR|uniref:DNA-binding response regulator n=1 Tax=Lysinibacillus fusiformis TaxID=28031 RepID=A0A2I0UYX1_9BACI|nr:MULTISPECIES: response regulator transcription factor [Lysinibacillus]KUF37380.1 transcriptional regulator [Lysinibacillus sp. F5]MEE3809568.1 response regulator transcription factor [Lysinibacillus fusiformis]PKU51263.1 DNA-binding response regulator [Lysinibacillus fusiformis]WCH49694.1 response regulator transcription factor [Lysinibacillus sp. OF-1]SCY07101.1 two-component system, OmpR family, response regulator VanR [Lysinibacillus sp. SG9]